MIPEENKYPYWLSEGCQNTFVIFDLLERPQEYTEEFLVQAYRILLYEGKDDALILLPENVCEKRLLLKMVVLEPDQSIAAFCGNGARAVAAYIKQCYAQRYRGFSIIAHDGEHALFFPEPGLYGVDMLGTKTDPAMSRFCSPKARQMCEQVQPGIWALPLCFAEKPYYCYFTETGEPHLVVFEELALDELETFGAYLNFERRDLFPEGMSVNRVRVLNDRSIEARTFERGVNRITKACGTGSTCSAVLSCLLGKVRASSPIEVQTAGGTLRVVYDAQERRSLLQGPATVWQP